jgi:hypothetical protein
MTPERQAAEQIARTLYVLRPADGELRWPDDWEQRATDTHREAYRGYGRACIEAISDAGLVIVPAATLAAMIDAQEAKHG